ncbi:MAG TPA: hypothetical protein VFZ73_01170, partial [Gemmatimonadaceae bacterium]
GRSRRLARQHLVGDVVARPPGMPPIFTGTASDNLMSNVQVDATHYAFRSGMQACWWLRGSPMSCSSSRRWAPCMDARLLAGVWTADGGPQAGRSRPYRHTGRGGHVIDDRWGSPWPVG